MSVRGNVLLTLVVALLGSGAARAVSAHDNVASFDATVNVTNPCTGETGAGTLDVLLSVNETRNAGGAHVTVHASLHGTLTGDRGSVYHVSADGTAQSSTVAGLYDIPFHGNAIGGGSTPNLQIDGTAAVEVGPGGNPIAVHLVSLSPSCER